MRGPAGGPRWAWLWSCRSRLRHPVALPPLRTTLLHHQPARTNECGLGPAEFSFQFGNPGDKPFVGDFDGDGIDEVGLHRESTGFVYYRNTLTTGIADNQFFLGDPATALSPETGGLSPELTPQGYSDPGTPPSTSDTATLRASPTASSFSDSHPGYR